MNFLLGASYGLASPIVLAIAAPLVVGCVIYAYLRRGTGKRSIVPTLFLLKALQGTPRSRKRFFPPLRFFFELLLLALLVLGGSGLYQMSTGDKYALIIDNSLSMAAKTKEVVGSENFAEKGILLARQIFNELPRNSEVEVFVTSPTFRSLNGERTTLSIAESALNGVAPSYSTDRISEGLQKLGTTGKYDRLMLVTDKNRGTSPNQLLTKSENISIRNVRNDLKELPNNIAISNISFSSGNFGGKSRVLTVAIDTFSSSATSARLIVRGCNLVEGCKTLDTLGEKAVKLTPKSTSLEEFNDIPEKKDIFFVELQSRDGASYDSNPLDNKAYLVLDAERSQSAVVSDLSPKELGLNLIEAVDFESIAPANYERLAASAKINSYSSIVFHRFAPKELPKTNSIFVMPPQDQNLFQIGKGVIGSEVTRWDVSNPLLSYLNVPGIRFKLLTPIRRPDWASEVISTTHGAGLIAGQSGNFRYAVFGFEIFPFEGRKTPAISVLTLNSLKWVANFSGTIGYQEVNTPLDVDSEISNIKYIEGEELYNKSDQNSPNKKIIPSKPGVLIIRKQDGAMSARAYNFFSREESDSLNPGEISIEIASTSETERSEHQRSLISWLTQIAFLLIILDLLFLLLNSFRAIFRNRRESRYRYGN